MGAINDILGAIPKLKSDQSYLEDRIRNGPSREVKGGIGNIKSVFPSITTGVTMRVESFNELFCGQYLDQSPYVTCFYPQGGAVQLQRINIKGVTYHPWHHPDFLVKLVNGTLVVIEVKLSSEIKEDLKKQYPRFTIENGRYVDLSAREEFEKLNIIHLVVTELDFGPEFPTNAGLLHGYLAIENPSYDVSRWIIKTLNRCAASTIEQLALKIEADAEVEGYELDRETYLECVNWLIVHGEIFSDLDLFSIQDIARFRLFSSRSIARCFQVESKLKQDPAKRLSQLKYNSQTKFHFLGETYSLRSSCPGKVYLTDSKGVTTLFDVNDLEKYYVSGQLRIEGAESKQLSPFAVADYNRQKEAIQRAEWMTSFEAGIASIPKERYNKYKRNRDEGIILYDCPLSGLLPKVRPGNTNAKVNIEVKQFAFEYLKVAYLGEAADPNSEWEMDDSVAREAENISAAWPDYVCRARENNLKHVCLDTFYVYYNYISKELKALKKKGKKAAYQVAPNYDGEWSHAPKGSHAGQIVEIDHTRIDVEVYDADEECALGRLWLTLAIDVYSGAILGWYLGFRSPSKVSLMMAVRDMVRTHQCMPECISIDGGREFGSKYFDLLLAKYTVDKRERSGGKPKDGHEVESKFYTTNKDLWHNLIGNTKLMVNPRQVSQNFIAKNRAIWGARELIEIFGEYVHSYNNFLIAGTNPSTPIDKYYHSYNNLLPTQRKFVAYDDNFKMLTMLEVSNKWTLKCRRSSLTTRGKSYSHPLLKLPELDGKSLPVKASPWDLRYLYFSYKGKVYQATLTGGLFQFAHSDQEVKILSDYIESKNDKRGKLRVDRLMARNDFLVGVKDKETRLKLKRAIIDRELANERESERDDESSDGSFAELIEQTPISFDFDSMDNEPVKIDPLKSNAF